MWALAPGSVHARPSAQAPINTSGNLKPHAQFQNPTITPFGRKVTGAEKKKKKKPLIVDT